MIAESGVFLAPDIIAAEVSSALSRESRLRQISAARAEEALSAWTAFLRDGAFVLTASVEILEEAFRLSLDLDHPLPGCLYLALSRRVGARFFTADERLARKAAGIEGLDVRLLGHA